MAAGQPLRGFVGQGLRAQKPNRRATEPFSFPTAAATYVFVPPRAGYWKFVGQGPGAAGSSGVASGGSGAYGEITRFLTPATPVSIVVNAVNDTTVTFLDGKVCTAGKATAAVGGSASGWDLSFSGSNGTATGGTTGTPGLGPGGGPGGPGTVGAGGAGAPGTLNYRGGSGGSTTFPGVGAGGAENGGNTGIGQPAALAVFIRT